ncbi:unnamed protein product [marine sediment metagenome]|uniref:Peptidase M20 dimerisation domain-containing protein n=1 Tax=marine sediment metagenome TaxID=412755 RepID=X1FQD7_9ZZZZ
MNSLPENEIIDLLANLVKAKSVNPPGREEVAARVLEDFFRRKGSEVRLDYISKGRPNVLCKVKGSGSGKSILLTSHLDVVPA